MRPRERQSYIIDTVRTQGKTTVEELASRFGTSVETIRRDLAALARSGKIDKIHGGAVPPRNIGEGLFEQRMQQNGQAKRHIAQKARALVSPGDTLMIDTGSSTLIFAEELAAIDDLTIITNSTAIANVTASGNDSVELYLLGGRYNEDNRETCGIMALDQLDRFRGNLVILAVGAIDSQSGVMDYSFDEAQIARAMLQRAERKIVLADSSKFDRSAAYVVAGLDEIDCLVCEQQPGGVLSQSLSENQVNVIY